jgi:hypothetical protein
MPTSLEEYYERIKNAFYLFVIAVGLVLITDVLSNIRTFVDRRFGFKKIGVFKVTAVCKLLTRKVVFLNNAHLFILNQKDYSFKGIKAGQIVKVERSATYKLMGHQITE